MAADLGKGATGAKPSDGATRATTSGPSDTTGAPSAATALKVTVWTISIRRRDETDIDEELTLLSSAGHAYWFEGGVVIQTDPDMTGSYYQERVVPWARIIEYHEEKPHA